MKEKEQPLKEEPLTDKEVRRLATEVFKQEYTSGLLVGLCIGAACGVAIAFVSHSSSY